MSGSEFTNDTSKPYKKKVAIGDCTLYLGDCMEVMPTLGKVDAVVTDPPYRDMSENQPTRDMRSNGSMSSFGDKPTAEVFDIIFNISNEQIIWGANNFNLPPYKGFLIWKKLTISEAFTMSMAELAFVSEGIGTVSKVFECHPQNPDKKHPTQKPLALMKWCIKFLPKETFTILDPFMGSGTTGVACAKMGRKFIGIEMDEDYFNIACKRIEEAYKSPDMFIEAAKKPEQGSFLD